MANSSRKLAAAALAVPLVAMAANAAAADKTSSTETKIQALQQQLESLQSQIADLKRNAAEQAADNKKQNDEVLNRVAETKKAVDGATKASITNGRPTISSADGRFTASIRANVQADYAYYMQNKSAVGLTGADLSSGGNIRRAQLGVQGKVFGDWSYNFLYDFGDAGTETPGKILYAYLQYDGLAPFALRFGAFAPAYSVEDQVSSSELMFFERNSPTNLIRNVAGSEGRLSVAAIYAGDEFFGSLAYSAKKIAETGYYDEQSAVVGRASYLVINDKAADAHLLIGGGFMHVFKLPDAVANGSTGTLHTLSLSDRPEISVDENSAKLINTGALPANHFTAWGLEIAGNYQNFYLHGNYNALEVARDPSTYTVYTAAATSSAVSAKPASNHFNAWFVQGSWVITGESKPYVPATGTFGNPKPAKPFSLDDGSLGAWELAARYSDTNLNDNTNDPLSLLTGWTVNGATTTKSYTYINQVRGGDQRNVTVGVNWYPNSAIKFQLDYMRINVNHLATSTGAAPSVKQIGQDLQAVALRAQVAF